MGTKLPFINVLACLNFAKYVKIRAMNETTTPHRWGEDPVTQYLDNCRDNQLATFANKRSQVIDLVEIDGMLRELVNGTIDPELVRPMAFLLRAHSAYLTAVGAVMAGQLHELHSLLRSCLEQASYGHYIGNDQERWELWMNRHDSRSRTQQDNWRKEFAIRKIIRNLKAADEDLGNLFAELYDQTIDYGGHPNERGMFMNSDIMDLPDGGKKFLSIYLQGDGLMLDFCLKMTAKVGLCVLRIAQAIYPTRIESVRIPASAW